MATEDKEVFGERKLWFIYFVSGMFFLSCALIFFVRYAMSDAQNLLNNRNEFVRKQILVYNQHNYLSFTKDISNISTLVWQIRLDAEENNINLDKAALTNYARDMNLDGILLLDTHGNIDSFFNTEGVPYSALLNIISNPTVLDIAYEPRKIYTDVIQNIFGYQFAFAAVCRPDSPGVILGYKCISPENAKQQNLTIQKLLSTYRSDDVGTILVGDGDNIEASNQEDVVGKSIKNNVYIQDMLREAEPGKLSLITNAGQQYYFGLYGCTRKFYVYNYMPASMVLQNVPRNMIFTLLFYITVVIVMEMLRMRSANRLKELQQISDVEHNKELQRIAHKADAANRAKTEFLQRMSHDIRTPINGIRGMVEIGNHYADDMAKQAECRQKILESSDMLLELVNEVLDMGKLESGEILLEKRPIDLRATLDTIAGIMEKQAEKKGITIYRRNNIRHNYILGSQGHLKRLIMNIVSNAIKYNKDNGKIYLACRERSCDGHMVNIELTCRDTGMGMSQEYQERIFEPFTREAHGADVPEGGTGLGMSIAKGIVDKMGGTISFVSQPGKGTAFFITLPFELDLAREERHAKEESAQPENMSLKGVNILLVEDNPLNQDIAKFMLENMGAHIQMANNGQEAVEQFSASQPGDIDIILMDIMMPVMNGYEAAKAIRSMDRQDATAIPIVAMTANAFTDDKQQAFEAGMNEHLAKPLDKDLLLKTLYSFSKGKA
mgnify:FL=1